MNNKNQDIKFFLIVQLIFELWPLHLKSSRDEAKSRTGQSRGLGSMTGAVEKST